MHISEFEAGALARGARHRLRLAVAAQPDGATLSLDLLIATGREPGPTVVVLAGIHGDEYEGILAVPEVFGTLEPAQMRGTVICVPVCNVPAFAAATRLSAVDGLNLARVFPGDANGTLTQRTAYWLAERVMRRADLIIDLHSGGIAYELPMLIGYYRAAGALGARTRAIAEAFGAEVIWAHPDMPPGRTLSFAAENGIAGIYTEAPGGGQVRPQDQAMIVNGVLNCLKHLGVVNGSPNSAPARHCLFGSGDLDHMAVAGHGGLFVARTGLLADVRRGQVLGEVRAPAGDLLEEVRAPVDGVIVTLRRLMRVNAGDGLFALAEREQPLLAGHVQPT